MKSTQRLEYAEKGSFPYEGTVWYKKSFEYYPKPETRVFIYFGAVNYDAKVYLNDEKIGEHKGGFTAFNFEITSLIKMEITLLCKGR
ncbi:MAG TPA: hypothetical protein DHV28_06690 [Ignavibacteriales bacterium]|nr:hypothetical protein [Ignavibacteriales bacterium]